MSPARSLCTAALVGSVVAAVVVTAPLTATAAPQAPTCSAFDDPVYQRVVPRSGVSLVTPWAGEAAGSTRYGFTQDNGTLFQGSTTDAPGLVPVHRLYSTTSGDFVASADERELESATRSGRYRDEGVSFYASPVAADCLVPVHRYLKSGKHRLAVSASSRTALADSGWQAEGVVFYAAPSGVVEGPDPVRGDSRFSFAVYPDTQQEVGGRDGRFVDRANWLVENRSSLDLRFVTHTGDVVNWDTPRHEQYEVASRAFRPLEKARIPYSLAIGNHDTQATGVGGSARDPENTRALQRDTTTFNDYFTADRYGGVSGAFERGKVDNVYSLYEAGDVKWMVLVLELWPRQSVVDWAKREVAGHPDHNVVVVTHEYLDADGDIARGAGYGDTSAQELYDQLVSRYANVRMVFSGHVGVVADRVDTGVHGNRIYSFLTAIHSNSTNPIRLVEVDTRANSIRTRIYAPWDGATWGRSSRTIEDVDWVR